MSADALKVSDELTVVCFRREDTTHGPYFVVREFDTKVIRARDKGGVKGRGPSEQAIRASIRQAILNMRLKSERASKAEIRLLKGQGILGKRAPSCSLLPAEDMIRLLRAFGKNKCAQDLHLAILANKKSFPGLKVESLARADIPSRSHIKVAGGKRIPATDGVIMTTPPKAKRPRRTSSGETSSLPRTGASSPTAGLDALLSAMQAFEDHENSQPASPASLPRSPSSCSIEPLSVPHSCAMTKSRAQPPLPLTASWSKSVYDTPPSYSMFARGTGSLAPSQLIMGGNPRLDQFSPPPRSPPISPTRPESRSPSPVQTTLFATPTPSAVQAPVPTYPEL